MLNFLEVALPMQLHSTGVAANDIRQIYSNLYYSVQHSIYSKRNKHLETNSNELTQPPANRVLNKSQM